MFKKISAILTGLAIVLMAQFMGATAAHAGVGDAKIRNIGTVTFAVCTDLTTTPEDPYEMCRLGAGRTPYLAPGNVTTAADTDGAFCGAGYRFTWYEDDEHTVPRSRLCYGSGIGNYSGSASLIKIPGCLYTCERDAQARRA